MSSFYGVCKNMPWAHSAVIMASCVKIHTYIKFLHVSVFNHFTGLIVYPVNRKQIECHHGGLCRNLSEYEGISDRASEANQYNCLYTVLVLSKLKNNRNRTATAPQPHRTVFKYFAIFKNVAHSLEPGETPSNSASHQASNYGQRS